MRRTPRYISRIPLILVMIILMLALIPQGAMADDRYMDGGYMGIPLWVYQKFDQTMMSNIIGVVHGNTLFAEPDRRTVNQDSFFDRYKRSPHRTPFRIFW